MIKLNVNEKIEKIYEIMASDSSDIDKYKQITSTLFERVNSRLSIQDWQIEWMKELRSEGKSYEDISKIVCVSMTTVRYYIVDGAKEKVKVTNDKMRLKIKNDPIKKEKYNTYMREYQRKLSASKKENDLKIGGYSEGKKLIDNKITAQELINETY